MKPGEVCRNCVTKSYDIFLSKKKLLVLKKTNTNSLYTPLTYNLVSIWGRKWEGRKPENTDDWNTFHFNCGKKELRLILHK